MNVVLDCKTTSKKRSIENDLQLPIYLDACKEIYDETIKKAGYLYIGDIGPKLQIHKFNKVDLKNKKKEIKSLLSRVENSSFENYTSGKHCKWCPHNDLPCSQH